ncbi:hypothetical protein L228DRAFT_243742 [Xylona heveae TC161]|uniref:Uncharacterized protein n=1 Tax=Xylona heveae (strain CBS 132557 / TC161) TaxID=1328760 RepID=A0A165IJJ5_XYLHT|nr:hypothetical protein L228DRAFT_243742 [Xylona heveae TC161]KZF24983.1 hypothetical protein L228DRAFT_243742 [Xylona heveae TC161]
MLPEGMEPPTDSKCYQAWHMGRVTFGRSPTFPQTTPSPITCGDYPTFSVLNASLTSSCARVFDSTLYPTMMGRGSGLIAECKLLPTQSLYAQPVTSVTDCREIYTTQSEQPKIHETLERNYFHEPSYAFSSCSDMIHFDYLDTQGRTVENPFQEPRPSISRLPQSASPRSDEQDTSSWCDSNILDHALPQDEFSERYASNFHLDSMNPTQAIKSHEDHVRSGSQFNFYPESKAATPASRGTSPCGFLALDSPLIKPLDSPRSALRGITCTPDTGQSKSTLLSSAAKDEFLISCKLAGMSYKDIKRKGHYAEAESTLRGRFRTLTKPKLERVRKPIWKDHDVSIHFRCLVGNF